MEYVKLLTLAHSLILTTNRMNSLRLPLEEILDEGKDFEGACERLNHYFEELKGWNGGAVFGNDRDGTLSVMVPFFGGSGEFLVKVTNMGSLSALSLQSIHVRITPPRTSGQAPVWNNALQVKRDGGALTDPTLAFEINRNHLWNTFWNPMRNSIQTLAGEDIFDRDSSDVLKFVQQAFVYL